MTGEGATCRGDLTIRARTGHVNTTRSATKQRKPMHDSGGLMREDHVAAAPSSVRREHANKVTFLGERSVERRGFHVTAVIDTL